ncbi:integrase family protein [Desulfofundulus kuznetsovii DSM 6115]|uniref:Integrase family protein n=1 Tax=Desulfofundulus kuznetsovii (strain DSM 6115 / VKM B-1805 / 17) TaxID=760568 RepID=A0AAU8P9W8_DESK7|nr:integrase family protein [Desulfofundulus kuznetsovii DSM 6115]
MSRRKKSCASASSATPARSRDSGGWQSAMEKFLRWKGAQAVSETTLGDYQRHITRFFRRFPDAWGSEDRLEQAVFQYMGEPVKPATYNLRLVYLKAFFKWCCDRGIIGQNPLDGFKRRKDEGRIVQLDLSVVRKLLDMCDTRVFSGLRDYALILVTIDTGIRPGEAFALLPRDVNLRSREITVRAEIAKTRVSRTLPIMPVTAQAIADLLAARDPSWGEQVPVFCTWEGTPLNRHTWGDRLEEYSKRLGVKIRPYDLRHTFALNFLRSGGNVFALQRTLGHADLTMTKRYLALTQDDIKAQHAAASPVNQLVRRRRRRLR